MVVPASKWKIVEETRTLAKGIRAAVQRRPDHPRREVQQGRGRLVEVHQKISEDMMTEISAVKKNPKGGEAQINSIFMMSNSGAPRFAGPDASARRQCAA